MKTRTFENHQPITTDADSTRVKSDYADPRGFGRDDTYLVGPMSNGKFFLFDYSASAYDDGNGHPPSRDFLTSGTPEEVFSWIESNRAELVNEVAELLGQQVRETTL